MISIPDLLKNKECENIEFKEGKNSYEFDKLLKYACALSNCGGGLFVLGINDKRPRKVVGSRAFSQPEQTRKSLMERLKISINFEELFENDLRVLVFTIAKRPVGLPIMVDGIAYSRHGEELIKMSSVQLRKIYEESGHDFSADVCTGLKLDDLDAQAIQIFREGCIKKSSNPRLHSVSDEQLLRDYDAISDDGITYAALILFGKRKALTKYLAQSEVVFEYRTSEQAGPAAFREELRDAFFNIHNHLWELINLRNETQSYQDGLFVFDIPMFNERTIREAILNAISHRNYQLGGSIFVKQYRDRLEITSPGGLPIGITVDNIIDRQSPRNRRIAELLSKCGLVERSGQGMNLIYENSIKEAKALPNFEGTDDYTVKLTLQGLILDKGLIKLINQINKATLESFTTQDFLVLNTLAHNEKLSNELRGRLPKLIRVGLIEKISRNTYILSQSYYNAAGEKGVYTRKVGLDKETNKKLLLKHIANQGNDGAQLKTLLQVLPDISRSKVQNLLREMKAAGDIYVIGKTSASKWFIKKIS